MLIVGAFGLLSHSIRAESSLCGPAMSFAATGTGCSCTEAQSDLLAKLRSGIDCPAGTCSEMFSFSACYADPTCSCKKSMSGTVTYSCVLALPSPR